MLDGISSFPGVGSGLLSPFSSFYGVYTLQSVARRPSSCRWIRPIRTVSGIPYRHTQFRSIHTHTRYARDTQTPRDTYHYSIQKWSILPLSSWKSALSLVNSFLIFFFSSTVIPLCWSRLESSCTSAMQAGSFTRPGIERDGWLVLTR